MMCFPLLIIIGMMEEGFGHIVNISSVAGKSGNVGRSTYCSAKFAIFGLMDSVRYEVRTYIMWQSQVENEHQCKGSQTKDCH